MKRSFIATLVVATALAAALLGFRLIQSGSGSPVYAQGLTVSLDMDVTNGSPAAPCAIIDATANNDCGSTYKIGLCATGLYNGALYAIGSFSFDVLYDDTKNTGTEKANVAPALDDNPDANEGTTEWGDGLGGFTCDNATLAYPMGDRNILETGPGKGDAFIACDSLAGPYTMGDNETAGVIAVIEFDPIAPGTDNLVINSTSYLAYSDASKMGECDPAGPVNPIDCFGGEDIKPPSADMSVTLGDEPDPVVVGEDVVYTATVTNGGPDAATNVELVFTLPDEKLYVTDSAECDDESPCTYDTGTVTCDLGDMNADDDVVCDITATAMEEGTHTTTASVSSDTDDPDDDPVTGNNDASQETEELLPHAYIDKIKDGATWCNPVQATSNEVVGDSHQLAVCVENLPEAVDRFELTVSYDDVLDTCGANEITCPDGTCLDDNPDANAGTTSWDGGLGTGWDCSIVGAAPLEPTCHESYAEPIDKLGAPDSGLATIWCQGAGTLTEGALAVLTLVVADDGVDNVKIESLRIWGDNPDVPMADCDDVDPPVTIHCLGATDTKEVPTNTPTNTPTPEEETHKRKTRTPTPTVTPIPTEEPTQPPPPPPPPPTATPFGGVGPEIIAPPTGSGPIGGGSPWMLWLLAGAAGTAAAAGGLYLRFARGGRRSGSG